ncbi:uncharacterized protein BCR38DRAFT_414781 [Pseudomassariella vexata]|uniref:AB hydrolase-1 domain-containing protein n=1 Tax=Pseudomassariella vexata TaxID=1141098 RepID=A0A1Y2D9J1_9PEZI|nr:uncharacterized protein BCR38DRAFT_414781 [Pseudomassariella vexata]ORY55928.1 hypothetical protein BCR38DRAFT_414781 [Pseudomassariella vexata]
MAKEFVSTGYRVVIFDSASSRMFPTGLDWVSLFHIVGFSQSGSIAVAFAAYHAHMLRSMTLSCSGGLIRKSHIGRQSRSLYLSSMIPEWLRLTLLRSSLEPRAGPVNADVPGDNSHDHTGRLRPLTLIAKVWPRHYNLDTYLS